MPTQRLSQSRTLKKNKIQRWLLKSSSKIHSAAPHNSLVPSVDSHFSSLKKKCRFDSEQPGAIASGENKTNEMAACKNPLNKNYSVHQVFGCHFLLHHSKVKTAAQHGGCLTPEQANDPPPPDHHLHTRLPEKTAAKTNTAAQWEEQPEPRRLLKSSTCFSHPALKKVFSLWPCAASLLSGVIKRSWTRCKASE